MGDVIHHKEYSSFFSNTESNSTLIHYYEFVIMNFQRELIFWSAELSEHEKNNEKKILSVNNLRVCGQNWEENLGTAPLNVTGFCDFKTNPKSSTRSLCTFSLAKLGSLPAAMISYCVFGNLTYVTLRTRRLKFFPFPVFSWQLILYCLKI